MSRTNDFEFIGSLVLNNEVSSRLSQHLKRTYSGVETAIISPIAHHISPDQILEKWDTVYSTKRNLINENLHVLEEQNRSKFGPRSIAIPWEERRSGVLAYFSDECAFHVDDKLSLLKDIVHEPRLRPLSLDSAMKFIKNNTNSGLPYLTRKSNVKEVYLKYFEEILSREDPCVMFTRTQEGRKTRPVWGFPFADTLNEMRYYRPLLEFQRMKSWRSALRGPNEVDRKLNGLVLSANSYKQKLLSIDFSQYDATVKAHLQEASFNYIKSKFQPQCSFELDYIAKRFNTIGIVTPDGIYKGEHGVPSGSTFTNEVDSISQYLIAKSINIDDEAFDVQGDDGAYRISDPDALKDRFLDFCLNVNEEKSHVSDNCLIYLQCLYDLEYIRNGTIGGIYPTYRALNRIVFPERYEGFVEDEITGSDYFSIRSIAILENCKHHPLFYDLVKLVWSIDSYNLKFSETGLRNYLVRISKSKGTEGILINQYGDNLTGIRSFKTMEVLAELDSRETS